MPVNKFQSCPITPAPMQLVLSLLHPITQEGGGGAEKKFSPEVSFFQCLPPTLYAQSFYHREVGRHEG